MELFKFTNLIGGPANAIPAAALDANFAKLKPLRQDGNSRQYLLTETPEGWSLRIFPDFPSGGGLHVLGVEGGALRWVPTNACT